MIFFLVNAMYFHAFSFVDRYHGALGFFATYAAPEDVRKLGRGECCGIATTEAGNDDLRDWQE